MFLLIQFANNPLATFEKGRDNFFEKSNLCCKHHLWASEIAMDVIRPPVNFKEWVSCWGNHVSRSVLWILLSSFVHLSIHPSVRPSAHLYDVLQHTISELAHQFFLIFCMKLDSYKVRKVPKLIFWEKVLSHQESQKWPENEVFRALTKIWPIHMYFLYLKSYI